MTYRQACHYLDERGLCRICGDPAGTTRAGHRARICHQCAYTVTADRTKEQGLRPGNRYVTYGPAIYRHMRNVIRRVKQREAQP